MSLLSLSSGKLSREIKCRKLANTGKFALFVHLQASSELLLMQSINLYHNYLLSRQFYKNTCFSFKAKNIFISLINVKMRWFV